MDKCIKCGGTMIGDGYTTALHCEFVELPEGTEADAPPTYCDYEEGETEKKPVMLRMKDDYPYYNGCCSACCATSRGEAVDVLRYLVGHWLCGRCDAELKEYAKKEGVL